MTILNDLISSVKEVFHRTPSITLPIQPSVVVDMGREEREQVQQTFQGVLSDFGLNNLRQKFEEKFKIRLELQPNVLTSALVSPIDSSLRVGNIVDENQRLDRRDEPEQHGPTPGLATYLRVLRAHVAPRNDVARKSENLNQVGNTYVAILDDGSLVSSVGPNSLMAIKPKIADLYVVNEAHLATLDFTRKGAESAANTQYTARYHSPYIVSELLKSQIRQLLEDPESIKKIAVPEQRIDVTRTALEKGFFEVLKAKDGLARELSPGNKDPIYERITDIKAAIPDIPRDAIRQSDEFGIVGFALPSTERKHLPPPETPVYVTLETRDGSVTNEAIFRKSIFGKVDGTLVLAPAVHGKGDDGKGPLHLDLFVQMGPAPDFHYAGSAAGRYGNKSRTDDTVAVGHKVLAVVDKKTIDDLVTGVNQQTTVPVTPEWVISKLRERKLIDFVDSSALKRITAAPDSRAHFVTALAQAAGPGSPANQNRERPTKELTA